MTAGRVRPPSAADDVLEERVDGVKRPARAAAGQGDIVPDRANDDLLRGQGRTSEIRRDHFRRRQADKQTSAGLAGFLDDREHAARDDVEEERQLLSSEALRLGGRGRNDDPGGGPSVDGKRCPGPSRARGHDEQDEGSQGYHGSDLRVGSHEGILT